MSYFTHYTENIFHSLLVTCVPSGCLEVFLHPLQRNMETSAFLSNEKKTEIKKGKKKDSKGPQVSSFFFIFASVNSKQKKITLTAKKKKNNLTVVI